jgi:hypothetical protein
MEEEVKFIFKTLIKVPIIILITYLVFNLFAFAFTYFRLLGFSYVAMQTVVENNYIPATEATTLTNYLNSMETDILTNLKLGCDTNPSDATFCDDITDPATRGQNERVQYGKPITVTVSARYKWVWPLIQPKGVDGEGDATLLSANTDEESMKHNIVIQYTVPGLKYYPDKST